MSATDCQFDYKQYQRMFHPKLPEICVYVSQIKRISEYELQRMFRVSKADVPYIYHALLLMGVIELVEGGIDY
ncbi:hypothetical protein J1785_04355, partial [Rahnella sp. SL6]|uniref:hypothetical protein n=1 Tax=Rahnella perminowiae TaxID=2816244 RepID=UPI001C25D640